MIEAWSNERSGWIVESIRPQCIIIATYQPLSGSSYMNLPVELRSPTKGLINIKKQKIKNVFYGVLLGILILQKKIQKELKKPTKKLLKILIMIKLSFLFKKIFLARLKKRAIFASMCLVMKLSWFFQFTL